MQLFAFMQRIAHSACHSPSCTLPQAHMLVEGLCQWRLEVHMYQSLDSCSRLQICHLDSTAGILSRLHSACLTKADCHSLALGVSIVHPRQYAAEHYASPLASAK